MPKVGMEPIRKRALVEAAIAAIYSSGSVNVTISDIAHRAGVSQGLAHHYFGSKGELLIAVIRHLLANFGLEAASRLKKAATPRERVSAIIGASLGEEQFTPETVAVWLAFYVQAQASPDVQHLLDVYARRLNSNLLHALRPLAGDNAERIAAGIAALIDGYYIRQALGTSSVHSIGGKSLVEHYTDLEIAASGGN
jgi:TetR/AcrR family transcriptional repressor of bet genes